MRASENILGRFEVRRLSTDTPPNCPYQLLRSQRCGLEVNDYWGEMDWWKLAYFPIREWGGWVATCILGSNAQVSATVGQDVNAAA